MFIEQLHLSNFLSFGPESAAVPLSQLNVLIGPNGSGKSKFIEALSVLQAAPDDITAPFRQGGGVADWLYRGDREVWGRIEAVVSNRPLRPKLTYALEFDEYRQRLRIGSERIAQRSKSASSSIEDNVVYEFSKTKAMARRGTAKAMTEVPIDTGSSILSQLRDPATYPDITYLSRRFESIRLYRNWRFGPKSLLREPQKPDEPNNFLAEDYSNLFLVLNQMESDTEVERLLLERTQDLLPDVRRLRLNIQSGSVLLYLVEGSFQTPATRLSDGTLRWLCLLAILLHRSPPPLVVIEEPEIGIHPDLIPALADLLKDASTRTQLIVTTHSDILIDALSETPESVLVVEKEDGQTTLKRLEASELKPWLEKYRLGALWIEGEIGGKRW
jgi:predicted ATPase